MEILIKHYDLLKLKENNYLNDTLINFYLKFIENEMISQQIRQQSFIFNTYFLNKLCPYDKIKDYSNDDRENLQSLFLSTYETVKRWLKEDIYTKDYLLFPLNPPEHWSLIIIYKPLSLVKGEADGCFLYLDSFGLLDPKVA